MFSGLHQYSESCLHTYVALNLKTPVLWLGPVSQPSSTLDPWEGVPCICEDNTSAFKQILKRNDALRMEVFRYNLVL